MMRTAMQTVNPEMIDRDYILHNLTACVRPQQEDDVFTIPCADLDMYFRCVVGSPEGEPAENPAHPLKTEEGCDES